MATNRLHRDGLGIQAILDNFEKYVVSTDKAMERQIIPATRAKIETRTLVADCTVEASNQSKDILQHASQYMRGVDKGRHKLSIPVSVLARKLRPVCRDFLRETRRFGVPRVDEVEEGITSDDVYAKTDDQQRIIEKCSNSKDCRIPSDDLFRHLESTMKENESLRGDITRLEASATVEKTWEEKYKNDMASLRAAESGETTEKVYEQLYNQTKAELDQVRRDLGDERSVKEGVQNRLADVEDQLKTSKTAASQLAAAGRRIRHLEYENKQETEKYESMKESFEQATAEHRDCSAEQSKLIDANDRIQELEGEAEDGRQELESVYSDLVTANTTLEEVNATLEEVRSDLVAAQSQYESLETSKKAVDTSADDLKRQFDELNRTLAQVRSQLASVESSLTETTTAKENSEARHNEQQTTIDGLNRSLAETTTAKENSEARHDELQTTIDELRTQTQTTIDNLSRSLADVSTAKQNGELLDLESVRQTYISKAQVENDYSLKTSVVSRASYQRVQSKLTVAKQVIGVLGKTWGMSAEAQKQALEQMSSIVDSDKEIDQLNCSMIDGRWLHWDLACCANMEGIRLAYKTPDQRIGIELLWITIITNIASTPDTLALIELVLIETIHKRDLAQMEALLLLDCLDVAMKAAGHPPSADSSKYTRLQILLVPLRVCELLLRSRTKFASRDRLLVQLTELHRLADVEFFFLAWAMLKLFIPCAEHQVFEDQHQQIIDRNFTTAEHMFSRPGTSIGALKGGMMVVARFAEGVMPYFTLYSVADMASKHPMKKIKLYFQKPRRNGFDLNWRQDPIVLDFFEDRDFVRFCYAEFDDLGTPSDEPDVET
ncbi:hypothetical protein B0A50_07681 [Salinomyces thailandicus]|uniref:Uncharacterized protein n=1 Tax=Salinomyces thailandicus TaxID=706561 RepID=A0A4V5N3B5_9PEZI|nr:hypothetical protein B0A50_07681 [Salinomyces thailandica]